MNSNKFIKTFDLLLAICQYLYYPLLLNLRALSAQQPPSSIFL